MNWAEKKGNFHFLPSFQFKLVQSFQRNEKDDFF